MTSLRCSCSRCGFCGFNYLLIFNPVQFLVLMSEILFSNNRKKICQLLIYLPNVQLLSFLFLQKLCISKLCLIVGGHHVFEFAVIHSQFIKMCQTVGGSTRCSRGYPSMALTLLDNIFLTPWRKSFLKPDSHHLIFKSSSNDWWILAQAVLQCQISTFLSLTRCFLFFLLF